MDGFKCFPLAIGESGGDDAWLKMAWENGVGCNPEVVPGGCVGVGVSVYGCLGPEVSCVVASTPEPEGGAPCEAGEASAGFTDSGWKIIGARGEEGAGPRWTSRTRRDVKLGGDEG